jgi:hypothetical protein
MKKVKAVARITPRLQGFLDWFEAQGARNRQNEYVATGNRVLRQYYYKGRIVIIDQYPKD